MNDQSKINLVIQYGCDDRFKIVCDTINVSKNYFKSIHVINSAPEFFAKKISDTFSFVKTYTIPFFYGDLEPCRRVILKIIPENEWFVHLDSDEIPTHDFLKNINDFVYKWESENVNVCRFSFMEHSCDLDGKMLYKGPHSLEGFPKNLKEMQTVTGFYPKRIFKNIEGWQIRSNYGMHEEFFHREENLGYFPHVVIHKKSEIQCAQSVILSSYSMPSVHKSPVEQTPLFVSNEMLLLNEFKKKTGAKTSNDLIVKIKIEKDPVFIEEFTNLVNSLKSSPHFPFMSFSNLLKFGLSFDTPNHYCGDLCCRYGEIQL